MSGNAGMLILPILLFKSLDSLKHVIVFHNNIHGMSLSRTYIIRMLGCLFSCFLLEHL